MNSSTDFVQTAASAHHQHFRHALRPRQRSELGSSLLFLRAAWRQAVFNELVVDARVVCLHFPADHDNQVLRRPFAAIFLPNLTAFYSECYKRRDSALQAKTTFQLVLTTPS